MSAYNLRAEVRHMLDSTSITDPGEIADKVLESMPEECLRDSLRETLRAYVRAVNAETRPSGVAASAVRSLIPAPATPTIQPTSGGHSRPGTHSSHAAAGRPATTVAPKKTLSWRGIGIRNGWQRSLDSRVHVGTGRNKMLRHCTYDDLQFAADEREQVAAKNAASARYYRSLASLVLEYDVKAFGDLPTEVIMVAVGGQS